MMSCMADVDVLTVILLTVLAVASPVNQPPFRIEAVLTGSCFSGAPCGDSVDELVAWRLGNASVTLTTTWVNGWSTFQIYLHVKSCDRRRADLLIIDEHLMRLVAIPASSSGCPVIIFPEIFQLKKLQPPRQVDNVCCDDVVDELDIKHATDNISSCLELSDTAGELAAVINHLGWKEVILVYDRSNEQEAKAVINNIKTCQLYIRVISSNIFLTTSLNAASSLPSAGIGFMGVQEMDGEDKIRDFLLTIYDDVPIEKSIHVVLVCSLANIKRIMTLANEFDRESNRSTAMYFRSRWLLSSPLERAVDNELTIFLETLDNLDNVAVMDSRYMRYKKETNTHESIKGILHELASLVDVREDQIDVPANITQILESRNERCLNTQVNTLYYGEQNGRYLNTVAMVKATQNVVLLGRDDIFPNIQFALNKRNLTVSVVEWDSFVIKNGSTYSGISIELLGQLEAVLNFTAHITEPGDGRFGDLVEEDTYNGLVGQLQKREVDMVVAPLTMLPNREKVLDFAFPFFTDYSTVMLRTPDPAKSKWRTLIDPFKWQVHVAIIVSLFMMAVMLTILERQNPYYKKKSEKTVFHNVVDSIWYMYGSLLTQGGEELPSSTTGLTLVSFWLMFSVVVASTYSGNLIAFLTVTIDTAPFDSLQGMLDQTAFKWGTIGNSPLGELQMQAHLLKISRDPVIHNVWESIKRFNQSDPSVLSPVLEDHKNKVLMGDYAFIGDKSIIDNWANGICHLKTIKESVFPKMYAIGLVNNSAYKSMVSNEIIKINDLGLLQMWRSNWSTTVKTCQAYLVTDAKAISVEDVQSAFYVLCIGIVLSALALAFERLRVYAFTRGRGRHYNFGASASRGSTMVTLQRHAQIVTGGFNLSGVYINEAVASSYAGVRGINRDSSYRGVRGINGASSYGGVRGINGSSSYGGVREINGASSYGGVLGVNGASSYGGVREINGASSYGGVLGVNGASSYGGVLGVNGASSNGGVLGVNGASSYGGVLGVNGASNYGGVLGINGASSNGGVRAIDLEMDVIRRLSAADVESGSVIDIETDSITQVGSSFYADSMDSGYDDHHQRHKALLFQDKVPFYLSRIRFPSFIGRARSTSL